MFINFCQLDTPDSSTSLLLSANEIIGPYIDANISAALQADEYGLGQASQYWDDAADYKYLLILMYVIQAKVKTDLQNCNLQTFEYYKDQFKLDCIRKNFACKKIPFNTIPLFNLFGVGTNFGFEGIDYMSIELDNTPICNETNIFEVQPNNP